MANARVKPGVRMLTNTHAGTTTASSADAHTVGAQVYCVRIAADTKAIHYQVGPGAEDQVYAIAAANATTNRFNVAGDHTDVFLPGVVFTVSGSTGNDGSYTVNTATFNGTATVINVTDVPDDTDDGNINVTTEQLEANANSPMLPAGCYEYVACNPGEHVFVIQHGAAGSYTVTDCE